MVMVGFGGDRVRLVGVEDHDVGVGADGDSAFFGEQAEDFGRVGSGDFDKLVPTDAAFAHAFGMQ